MRTLAERLLKYTFETLLKKSAEDLAFFDERIEKGLVAKLEGIVRPSSCAWITAKRSQYSRGEGEVRVPGAWGDRLQSEHERYLTEKHVEEARDRDELPEGHQGVLHARQRRGQDRRRDGCAGAGIGEIIGGSQREERLDVLDARMEACHIDKEHYTWYRDLRRYGTVPHAGFGLGFERTICVCHGLANVRDAIPFPRTPGNARY
jgi:asparaginyl-tRNA synthetase